MADQTKDAPKTAAASDQAAAENKAELPTSVTLAELYGYYDDAGTLRLWAEGQGVTDADQIADLIERKAPLK